jgi:DNA-binding transcriptional regulator YdaS (Cro superfamily)
MDDKQKQTSIAAVCVAVQRLGGHSATGEAIGVTRDAVYKWTSGASTISAENAVALARASGLRRADFRPDIFGGADDE